MSKTLAEIYDNLADRLLNGHYPEAIYSDVADVVTVPRKVLFEIAATHRQLSADNKALREALRKYGAIKHGREITETLAATNPNRVMEKKL